MRVAKRARDSTVDSCESVDIFFSLLCRGDGLRLTIV